MKAFKVFIFGLLYGWFIKVAFDRIYRGNEMEDIRNENASLQEYIRTLESKLQTKSMGSTSVIQPASQPKPVPPQPTQPEPVQPAQSGIGKDNLKVIKGVGPALEKKLNEAGILTFEALAGLSVKELERILGNARRLAQEGDLIAQAKRLARQNKR
jgi:predicted flap endonuclease-1-like 5' DNA nuclease